MARAIAIVVGLALALLLLVGGLSLGLHRPAAPGWKEFSIGPASGWSAMINPGRIHADGITLLAALSVAYEIPSSHIVGPGWLADRRLAIDAAVPAEAEESFRPLMRRELEARLGLTVHFEERAFDLYVLRAGAPQLERSAAANSRTAISDRDVRLERASMKGLASALQTILSKPVVDETGIDGWYDMEFAWGEDRRATVASALHNRFGLELGEGRQRVEALVIDRIQPDAAMSVMMQVGRMTGMAPMGLRRGISSALAIR